MKIVFYIIIYLFANVLFAQKDTTKNLRIVGLPILYYSPETSLAFGAAGFLSFKADKTNEIQRLSQMNLGAAYTLENQLLTYASFDIWLGNNDYNLNGEVGYYRYFYNFYGLGNGPRMEELYSVNYPRLRFQGTKNIAKGLYAGVKYTFDDFDIVQREFLGQLQQNTIAGSDGGRISGAGFVLSFDTRDNNFYPRSGWKNSIATETFTKVFGSDFNYQLTSLDITKYFSVKNKGVLAANIYGRFINKKGLTPFFHLSDMGGSKRMRGYYQGYYKDKQLAGWQAEYRFPLFWRLGLVGFAGNAVVANQVGYIKIKDVRTTAGLGLRVLMDTKRNINLRLDYGFSKDTQGFYLTIGEAF